MSIDIAGLSNEDLVSKTKELKGMSALEKKFTAEVKKRLEEGIELPGVTIGKPSTQERVIAKKDLMAVLSEAGVKDEVLEKLVYTLEVSGKLKFD